ncbi:carboxypeptidase-like regulatory domain-containing protein [Flavobacterium sp. HXWNR29]|uniref:carboxypeptidase-like regulatory domain-containing protein n=1 Tax=Flavobacterium odoriferum TaxID=2946604 RepID=UPI0021CB9497|nr:carboxypeptidase-like regulatory domain-containing protein [Flavobacterium sp. HXWNR29]MCU4189701.1 carboxypeptidase-like regulatory domain-containing protein [Flavobacterium sp. HXWNR29]
MLKKLLFFFFIFPMFIFSQNDTLIKGKVVSESNSLEGIHIFNISQKTGEITDARGYFNIKVKISDTLQFSAVHLKATQYIIKQNDLKEELIFVQMKSLISELDEITLTKYKNINAVSLGIVPANQKTYTPAERKVRTATTGLLDPLINWASGRTKMLKNQVVVEGKEQLQAKTSDYFERKYFLETLNIPEEYVDGFLFYIVDNERYARAMKDKNKTMATFILSELAVEYLKLKEIEIEKSPKDEK